MKKSNKKGFTLVELVIVIAVIAILAAVLIPTFGNVIENAHQSSARQAARNAYTEIMTLTDADLTKLGATAISTTTETEDALQLAVIDALEETGVTSVQYNDAAATLVFVVGNYTVTNTLEGAEAGWTVVVTPVVTP